MADTVDPQQLAEFIEMCKKLASKSIICYLKTLLEARSAPQKLIRKLEACMTYNYCGYLTVEFEETPVKLNISLSLVPRDYRTEIDIPSADYANDLIKQYNMLKAMALAYWVQFQTDHPALYAKLQTVLSDLDISAFRMDQSNPTTIYLDPMSEKRVGIFCYYTNPDGRPIMPK